MSEQTSAKQPEQRATGPTWRRVVVIGVLLPLVAASLLIWSASGREDQIDQVPVAIVNNDTIITDPKPMAAGRSLAAALTHPDTPSNNLQWVLADEDNANAGLRDGTFYAVLTIPSDFSSAILSSGTDKPVQGKVTLVSNAAASTTVPYLSSAVANAAAAALGNQVTVSYLGQVYDGFNSLAQGNQQSASGAAQLASGTQQLTQGANQLAEGAGELAGGLDDLQTGSAQLATGADSVHTGAVRLDDGVSDLARGTRRLHDDQARLASGTRALARESDVLAGRARELHQGARGIDAGTRVVAGGSSLLSREIAQLAHQCEAAGGSLAFCVELGRAAQHTETLAAASARLETATGKLAAGSQKLADGAGGAARGTDRVAASSQALSNASGRLSNGASSLQSGAAGLASGAAQVDSGAAALASGTRTTARAGHQLASGSASLASSAGQLDDGAQQLSSGLAQAAAESPTYSKQLQQTLSAVVAQPVALAAQVQHTAHGNGWLIAIILGVILWLAALVAALSIDQSAVGRNAMAPVSSRMVAVTQSLPVLGFATLNAAAVIAALIVFHPSTAAMIPLVLLVLLASATFGLLALALRLRLGRVGLTLFVLFLILQVAASGNVVPLETAPSLLQKLNAVMPLTAFVNGASQLVSGGHVASFTAVVGVLLAWAVVSGALLLSAVKKRRLEDQVRPARVALAPG